MKRALVFVRSDYLFEPVSQQCHMAWCSEWLPVHGTGIMLGTSLIDSKQLNVPYDNYALLSCISPYLNSCFDPRDDRFEWEKIRGIFDDWREYAERFSGDYYPLCSIDLSTDSWAAWQFNRPEEGDGVIQAFRRRDNPEQNRVFALNDLEPDAEYIFRKYGSGEDSLFFRDCLREGLRIYTYPAVIGHLRPEPSSWFTGYNEKYFFDKGVLWSQLFPHGGWAYGLAHCLKQRKRYGDFGLVPAWRAVCRGLRQGKRGL